MNKEQRLHFARSLETIAVGQFIWLGYHALVTPPLRYLPLAGAVVFYGCLEAAALYILRKVQ